ncbi:hypothetical protein [Flexivirga meconopsidis]|uniref:hypothetical protein n=1 Tax=Flexivirga meconopsidis TaxID=2977121 RepID=UPI00224009F1|nr:hypothetical protein [Flexivirga meconopsidis]
MPSPGRILDRSTRLFWRAAGRPVDLTAEHAWLASPTSRSSRVGDDWLATAATALGGRVERRPDAGLLADLSALDGAGFSAAALHPDVRGFYEHTSAWRMEVWTQWNPLLQPGGAAVAALFGRRVQQLAIPTRPLDVAHGMDSTVAPIVDATGRQVAAGWLRTLRSSGDYVYSGCYSVRGLPGASRPSVHVAFPLEEGNVQVFLRPTVEAGGALRLTSPVGRFGTDGAYVVVRIGGRNHAARAPIHETFRVYVDDEGTLRTDHDLRFRSVPAVRLHYKLTRIGG